MIRHINGAAALVLTSAMALPVLAWGQAAQEPIPITEFLARGRLLDQFPNMAPTSQPGSTEFQLIGSSVRSTAILHVYGPRPGTVSRARLSLNMDDEVTRKTQQEHIFLSSDFVRCFGIPVKPFNDWFKDVFDRTRASAQQASHGRAVNSMNVPGYRVDIMHSTKEIPPFYVLAVTPTQNQK